MWSDKRQRIWFSFVNPSNTDAKATELGHFDSHGYPTDTYLGSYGLYVMWRSLETEVLTDIVPTQWQTPDSYKNM